MRIQVIVPLIIGLSVCGIGSVFVYQFLNQKRKDDDDETDEDTYSFLSPSLTSSGGLMSVEFPVPNSIVPVIVGKQNLSLRSLENKTGSKVSFREDPHTQDHQICRIEGAQEAVEDAQRIVVQFTSRPTIVTEELEVSQSACGKILGRFGERLQEICRKSNAKVSVNSSTSDMNQRQVVISGTQMQVIITTT